MTGKHSLKYSLKEVSVKEVFRKTLCLGAWPVDKAPVGLMAHNINRGNVRQRAWGDGLNYSLGSWAFSHVLSWSWPVSRMQKDAEASELDGEARKEQMGLWAQNLPMLVMGISMIALKHIWIPLYIPSFNFYWHKYWVGQEVCSGFLVTSQKNPNDLA